MRISGAVKEKSVRRLLESAARTPAEYGARRSGIEQARARDVRRICADITRTFDVAFVPDLFAGMCTRPAYLEAAWELFQDEVGLCGMDRRTRRIVALAITTNEAGAYCPGLRVLYCPVSSPFSKEVVMLLQRLPTIVSTFSIYPAMFCAVWLTAGCVGIDDYRAVTREAEGLRSLLQAEQRRVQDMEVKLRELTGKAQDLERAANAAREEAARREREYKEIRDELLALKIPLEQRRVHTQRSRAREGSGPLESELRSSMTGVGLPVSPPTPAESSKQRLKDALQEFQRLLDVN
jgi:hypothetical protein